MVRLDRVDRVVAGSGLDHVAPAPADDVVVAGAADAAGPRRCRRRGGRCRCRRRCDRRPGRRRWCRRRPPRDPVAAEAAVERVVARARRACGRRRNRRRGCRCRSPPRMRSPAVPPSMRSSPPWPWMRSRASSPRIASLPAPPAMLSRPVPPEIVSLPPRAKMRSAGAPAGDVVRRAVGADPVLAARAANTSRAPNAGRCRAATRAAPRAARPVASRAAACLGAERPFTRVLLRRLLRSVFFRLRGELSGSRSLAFNPGCASATDVAD